MRRAPQFTNIRTEGGLLPADLLLRVASLDRDLEAVSPEDYHLAPGERITEAIDRSWNRLAGAWEAFAQTIANLTADDRTATEPTRRRWSLVLFQELGYGQLQVAKAVSLGDKSYPISHAWGAVPFHLVGARVDLDRRTPGVAGAAAMSPHGLMQELLNRSDHHLWGIVTNGLRLRLLRDNAALTRQAFVEFDLEAIFTGQAYADFVVLWFLCHESRLEGDPPEKCVLERWMAAAAEQGTRALDQLRNGVETAIAALGEGFLTHKENRDLRQRLRAGDLSTQDYYRQLLRLVYRLIFLFVAEDRDLLLDPAADQAAHERYRRFYALGRVRRLGEARRGGAHPDLWAGLQVVFDGLGSPLGLPQLGLPPLGSFLWSEAACSDLDAASISNRALLAAVRALTSVQDGKVLRSVDYRNLGSEELGSIYESLLELHPQLSVEGGTFSLVTAAGHERKTTGSYYTPTALITELLDSALEPILEEAMRAEDPEAAILGLTVLDPACGSGHFLISAAHRIARRLASVRTGDTEPSPIQTRIALRDVISRCLHGVDVNEMAVELCKVSLWMEAMEPGKPLSFLDHRIAHGNSLIGATPPLLEGGVPDEAFKPLEGDEKATVTALRRRNKQEREGQGALLFGPSPMELATSIAAQLTTIDAMQEDTLADVQAKETRWLALQRSAEVARAQLSADAWCAAFVARKAKGSPPITEAFVRQALTHDQTELDPAAVTEVIRLRNEYRFLHLHLAFPHVFAVSSEVPQSQRYVEAGFDLVLGNPPWERVKLQEKEWFTSRAPEIAGAPNAATRKRMIKALQEDDPSLYKDFLDAVRRSDGESHFLRCAGRYPLCGRGDVNTYAVFAETMRMVASPTGRVGAVVPAGIATSENTKEFFADLVDSETLVSLFDFSNRGFFGDIAGAQGNRFCLLTFTGGTRVTAAEFVFFAQSLADLADEERRFSLEPSDFRLLNPNSRTCPVFKTRRDADITRAAYLRTPVFIEDGPPVRSPWRARFQRPFDMATDSELFRSRKQLEAEGFELAGNRFVRGPDGWLPLYEAKMFHQFDHRFGDYRRAKLSGREVRQIPTPEPEELARPDFQVLPRYWVPASAVDERMGTKSRWLLGFRGVTSAIDYRTVIATALPRTAVGDPAQLVVLPDTEVHGHALVANLSSFAFDFLTRQKLGGTHLSYFVFKQLPVLPPDFWDEQVPWESAATRSEWVGRRVLELIYTAADMTGFARQLGYEGPPFTWDSGRRSILRAELDAAFFLFYEMDRTDVEYVMETFPIARRRDEAAFGEFLTKRLILDTFDALERARARGRRYDSVVDRAPGLTSAVQPAS